MQQIEQSKMGVLCDACGIGKATKKQMEQSKYIWFFTCACGICKAKETG